MSGILDPKSRIMDSFVTTEGRRQIASGKFKAEFFSFTDGGTFYDLSDTFASSSQDMQGRVMLECANLPQDQITFEIDDSGKLVVREIQQMSGSMISVLNGRFFSGSLALSSSQELTNISYSLLDSSLQNFNNLYLLGSSPVVEDKPSNFIVYPNSMDFVITDQKPLPPHVREGSLDHIESLFADKKMSHVPNYKYLPPVNKARAGQTPAPLGRYAQVGQQSIVDFQDLESLLNQLEQQGFAQEVSFLETSIDNRVMCQFFEKGPDALTKLDVIDFGLFADANTLATKHVYFVGKLFLDSFGSHTFVNMFTLVWS